MKESPIFLKTHDLLVWLMGQTIKFPKSQRFVLALRLQQCSLNFYEYLVIAVKSGQLHTNLLQADIELEKLRHHLRLCRDLKLLSLGQFEHVVRMLEEIGRLLGAWLKRAGRE